MPVFNVCMPCICGNETKPVSTLNKTKQPYADIDAEKVFHLLPHTHLDLGWVLTEQQLFDQIV